MARWAPYSKVLLRNNGHTIYRYNSMIRQQCLLQRLCRCCLRAVPIENVPEWIFLVFGFLNNSCFTNSHRIQFWNKYSNVTVNVCKYFWNIFFTYPVAYLYVLPQLKTTYLPSPPQFGCLHTLMAELLQKTNSESVPFFTFLKNTCAHFRYQLVNTAQYTKSLPDFVTEKSFAELKHCPHGKGKVEEVDVLMPHG